MLCITLHHVGNINTLHIDITKSSVRLWTHGTGIIEEPFKDKPAKINKTASSLFKSALNKTNKQKLSTDKWSRTFQYFI